MLNIINLDIKKSMDDRRLLKSIKVRDTFNDTEFKILFQILNFKQ